MSNSGVGNKNNLDTGDFHQIGRLTRPSSPLSLVISNSLKATGHKGLAAIHGGQTRLAGGSRVVPAEITAKIAGSGHEDAIKASLTDTNQKIKKHNNPAQIERRRRDQTSRESDNESGLGCVDTLLDALYYVCPEYSWIHMTSIVIGAILTILLTIAFLHQGKFWHKNN